MSEEALANARRLARNTAEAHNIVVPMSLLMDLVDEVERWQKYVVMKNEEAKAHAKPGDRSQPSQSKPQLVKPEE